MKILIDLIHPANFHYFKNFFRAMRKEGHNVFITAREKDVLQDLLNIENEKFISSGSGRIGKGAKGKFFYIIYAELFFFKIFYKYKPDIVLSFGSTPCAHNSFLFRIPHISFDDTEHAKLNRRLYKPFTKVIFTPESFYLNLGQRQFKFKSFMELFYLHPLRFKPDKDILAKLNLYENGKKIILFRFVSWEAFHDIGQTGINTEEKINLVIDLSKNYNVLISSEGFLPEQLSKFKFNLPSNKLHDLLSILDLYIGEGGTMASECSLLGVPSIYINSLPLMGYLKYFKEKKILFHLAKIDDIEKLAKDILNDPNAKNKYSKIRHNILHDKIDPTSLLIWFVNNYPESWNILLKNPDVQNKFKG